MRLWTAHLRRVLEDREIAPGKLNVTAVRRLRRERRRRVNDVGAAEGS
jgi:hypothetical protein